MEHHKLVRDNIPDIIKSRGATPITHIADDNEYKQALLTKITEEVAEFTEKPSAEEMADIMEVLKATCTYFDISETLVEEERVRKAAERGGFEKRIILERTEE